MEHVSLPPRPNRWLMIAGAVMLLTTFVHVFAGGPEVYDPVRAAALDPVVRSVVSVVWHATTVILAMMAFGLFWVGFFRNRPLEVAIVAVQVSFAGLFIAYGFADLNELGSMPQWSVFLVCTGLILLAWRGKAS